MAAVIEDGHLTSVSDDLTELYMKKTKITVEKEFTLAKVDDRLYSSFIEHLGRAVYDGIYEPGHPLADEQGFRKDVIQLVKDLHVAQVRYPGGNFLSGYKWTDGIGPRNQRPTRLDLAWHSLEPNIVGIDEFYDWSKKAGTAIMGAVNMGTGTPQDAANMLEYCNFAGGTYWSDLRKKNGHADPYGIKTWCVGNEMDGPWQICHLEAADYGKKARETAKMMKWVDDSVELVVCGSASSGMPTYPEWDRIVLEHTYENVDFLSLHRYYENFGNDDDFLASFVDMNNFIKSVCATADYVKALKRSKKTMYLSFDEWNVWYQSKQEDHPWMTAPSILEDQYSLLDALVFGGLGITLLNNADRVKVACLAQLVNVIAPIFTEKGGKAIKQAIYYPFQDISLYGHGTVLTTVNVTDKKETCYGDAPTVATSVVYDEETGMVTLFALNTDKTDMEEITLNMDSFGKPEMVYATELTGSNLHAKNTFAEPEVVSPQPVSMVQSENGVFTLRVKPASWNVFRFKV